MTPFAHDDPVRGYLEALVDADRVHDDPITGLPNRTGLLQALDARRSSALPTAVAVLGMDNFRSISVTLGPATADDTLRVVAARLLARLPPETVLSRLDGDEFAMLLDTTGQDPKQVEALLNAILLDLAQPCAVDMHEVHLDACVGIVVDGEAPVSLPPSAVGIFGQRHAESLEVVARAQLALHHAKRSRGRMLQRYEPSMRTRAEDRRQLELDLRRAASDGEFELFYQPQVDLGTGAPIGAEALLRWRHPVRGLLNPAEFIEALAASGIAAQVGWWVLDRACRDAMDWPLVGGERMTVSVNLFPSQFAHEDFLHEVDGALRRSGLPPENLELELTETIALRDDGAAKRTLQALRERGVRAAYDDFGTGFASLSMLHHLSVDRVKIDRSFVRNVMADRGDAAIVRSILLIARNFDMQVTAEGVESSQQADFLRALGCDVAQGFLWSEAKPVASFGDWLRPFLDDPSLRTGPRRR